MAGRTSRSTTARASSRRAAVAVAVPVVPAAPALRLDRAGAQVAEVRHQLGLECVLEGGAPLARRRCSRGRVIAVAPVSAGRLRSRLGPGSQRQRDLALGIDL